MRGRVAKTDSTTCATSEVGNTDTEVARTAIKYIAEWEQISSLRLSE